MKTDTAPKNEYLEIACRQVLAQDHTVFSTQGVVIPETGSRQITSDAVLELYLAHIERCTLRTVHPAYTKNGLEFRLAGSSIPLIKFGMPVHDITTKGTRSTLPLSGGFLVEPGESLRGELDFLVQQAADGTRVTLRLSDFHPLLLGRGRPSLWWKWLYLLPQAYIHKIVTVRFLARLYRRFTGENPKTRVVQGALRKGEGG